MTANSSTRSHQALRRCTGTPDVIAEPVREWFEQQLIETVMGVRALEGARLWSDEEIEKAYCEEALTAAVLPRYHVYTSIKRSLGSAIGSVKDKEDDQLTA
jgi:hypothetical protein